MSLPVKKGAFLWDISDPKNLTHTLLFVKNLYRWFLKCEKKKAESDFEVYTDGHILYI